MHAGTRAKVIRSRPRLLVPAEAVDPALDALADALADALSGELTATR